MQPTAKRSIRLIPFTLALAIALPAGMAMAITPYDARTMGMGGSSIGDPENASLAYWNPADVAMGHGNRVFLPSLAFSLGNNILSPGQAIGLATAFNNLGKPATGASTATDFSDLFKNLGSSQGLTLQAEGLFEPVGFSMGKVGPGAMAFRVYGHGTANAHLTLSQDFATNLNNLFFGNGFTNITSAISTLTKEAGNPAGSSQAQLKADVTNLQGLIEQNMSAFIKNNGAAPTPKTLALTEVAAVDATAAVSYAQVLPFRLAMLPKSEISVGATAKLFGAPAGAFAGYQQTLPGGTGTEKISPIGGGAGADINLNIDKEVTDLDNSIKAFQADQNIATTADLAAKAGNFIGNGLSKSNIQFSNLTPDSVGAGLDLGAAMKIDDTWSVGLSLVNPLVLWGATQTTYKYDFSGDTIVLKKLSDSRTSFNVAEPFIVRAGGAYKPVFPGASPALAKGLMVNLGVEAPINNGVPASVQLGVEKVFMDAFAIRLGTSQLGLTPLYTAGFGVQTQRFQANFAIGADNPTANVKALATALTLGLGF